MVENVTPQQVQALLKDKACVYLDVRTPEEFEEGHPPGARNVPLMLRDPASGRMVPNQEFAEAVQAGFKTDTVLVVGCKSGGRSASACQVLAQLGYARLHNMLGGFHGKPGEPGWLALNLPVETGA